MKKLLQANTAGGARRIGEVFRDFCELTALCFRSAVDRGHGFDERRDRFSAVAGKYSTEEMQRFDQVLDGLVATLEAGFTDALGELYMSLDLGNERLGQFFTPYDLSLVTAKLTIGDTLPLLVDRDFITVSEPASGSGGMIIALAHALRDEGVNYQQRIHVTATDLDPMAVFMTYVQLTLINVPALVVHGNTLTQERFDVWPTPAHVLGGWRWKLAAKHAADDVATIS
ncbi:N-6 DNA methylase [Microbacterium sp. SL62]|uniref:N-6 DNA methylase n=1 Tax=Microbacterium sp. SL62 TaxID=2995139 RepID=UPI002276EA5C|nr:N-6 DNA methylase [Microbacterium sp. SL62]MCY1718519.1 N-6 DNA methylase [Microbacterium sp. SL62]